MEAAGNEHSYNHLIGFFDQAVLASYQASPDKFTVTTDNFEGRVTATSSYYDTCTEQDQIGYIDVRFGYRTLRNGDFAVVAFMPDLLKSNHLPRWRGFALEHPEWTSDSDRRFDMWVKRYLHGSWEIDNGPLFRLIATVQTINALTTEVIGLPLFSVSNTDTLNFPTAQNDHRYQDAHQVLYGYLIDGLNKDCIAALTLHMTGNRLNLANDNTIKALQRANVLPTTALFWDIQARISAERRKASHHTRSAAQHFAAFETFNVDLEQCISALEELTTALEGIGGMQAYLARERQDTIRQLPQIARSAEEYYSICKIEQIKGKTVASVKYGFRQECEEVHQSEVIILYFTDGSILSIDTGSNAGNIAVEYEGLSPEDFHTDFILRWVPALIEATVPQNTVET